MCITLFVTFWQGNGYSRHNAVCSDKACYSINHVVPRDFPTAEPHALRFQIEGRRGERKQ